VAASYASEAAEIAEENQDLELEEACTELRR
jgi:hypothetical protein